MRGLPKEEFPRPERAGKHRVRGVPVPDLGSRGFRLIDEGNLVNAGQQTGIASNVLIVPAEVVQHGQNGLYVFIVDDQNRAQVRQVKIARQDTATAVIADGLKEGDRVVTSGQFLLQPGSIVSIDTGSGT